MLRSALAYLSLNLAVIPLRENAKTPLTPHGVKDASVDPDEVKAWWRKWPRANIGLAVPASVIVVDVDVRNDGLATVATWPELPTTPKQVTATGGSHTLLKRPQGNLRGKAGPGVDILGTGRYIVAAPSVIDGVKYRWTAGGSIYVQMRRVAGLGESEQQRLDRMVLAPIAPCPPWLAELIRIPDVLPPAPLALPSSDLYERAVKYLETVEPAISGQGGSRVLFRVASLLSPLPLPISLTAIQPWNARCVPPWTTAELTRALTRAATRSTQLSPLLRPRQKP
jgi:hypothetical protein